MKVKRNTGFDRRIFLTAAEWDTFCRRKPVRYIRKSKERVCQVCGLPATPGNPLQNAHIISFDVGVIDLALTPDYLDSDTNIVSAHRNQCNKAAELDLQRSMIHLGSQGITELPTFLPRFIHELWIESRDKEEIADGQRDDCLSRQRDDETHRSREPAG